ncbi:MAG: LPXTG cell wall anchor domain-containing protein [Dactylosporangium sp.]|nr:LPXTG cell wall anchor domain-containing protein [Dactylosporangium sp.]NNJ59772.1 LPXTG cell wall anchor domain-containing protein [Dactylosporangium sp.]
MSQPKVLGPMSTAGVTVATLPVTGQSVVSMVLVGVGCVAVGGLLIRATRLRRETD